MSHQGSSRSRGRSNGAVTIVKPNEAVVKTWSTPTMLEVVVMSPVMQKVQIYAKDTDKYQTCYSDRTHEFEGVRKFLILLPWNERSVTVVARRHKTGQRGGVMIVSVAKKHLPTRYGLISSNKNLLSEFLELARFFCTRASYLEEGKYDSSNGNVKLWYMDELLFTSNGKTLVSTSPARVNSLTGIIQCARSLMKDYTVAGRFAILCHEFSHFFLNKVMSDEEEADNNAAKIYLSLGFPRVDLLTTWCKVYDGNDTPGNRERYKKWKEYVNAFEI